MPLTCPRCQHDLARVDEGLFADVETHACAGCRGTFYPAGSLDRLDDSVVVNVERIELRDLEDAPPLRCPGAHALAGGGYRASAAGTLLFRAPVDHGDLVIAKCDECGGFWLEGDALERLRALALELSTRENRELNEEARRRAEQARKRTGQR